MQPFQAELMVIKEAERLAESLGGDVNHSVAAAAMDIHGVIHKGVNVDHFTGGPCAEIVVLGAAATVQAPPLMTIAAAGDDGRGLIPPCGKCRQVLLDYHPDINVALPGKNGPEVISIRELLPTMFRQPDAPVNRFVRFDKRYFDDVRTGTKTTTVRWKDPITLGRKEFVFDDHPDHPVFTGEVIRVERFNLAKLTADQAKLEPDIDMTAYREGLHARYPDMPPNAEVDVVEFRVLSA